MSEEEQAAIRASNEDIRTQRSVRVEEIATHVAKFKRDFIGAPIRRALLQMQKDQKVDNCEIPYRKDEKYWILGSGSNEFSFFHAFNFSTQTDVLLARIILLEFKDSVRHVKSSVSISYHDKGAPSVLTSVFPNPGRETYSNGILEISKC